MPEFASFGFALKDAPPTLIALLALILLVGLTARIFREAGKPADASREKLDAVESEFRTTLIARVQKLEQDHSEMVERLSEQAKTHAEQIAAMREKLAEQSLAHLKAMNEQRIFYENETRILRHCLMNERAVFQSVERLADVSPEKLRERIVELSSARAQREAEIALEAKALGHIKP